MAKGKNRRYSRTPEVFQAEVSECGAAALSIILRYFGCALPMERLRIECGVSRDGCNAADIVRAGVRLGLECHGYRVELGKLKKAPTPCILYWRGEHFVVLEGIRGGRVYINDPDMGHCRLRMAELKECYSGVVITCAPTDRLEKHESDTNLWHLIQKRLGSERAAVRFAVLSGIALAVPGLLIPKITQTLLDNLSVLRSSSTAGTFLLCLALLYAFQVLLTAVRSYVLTKLRTKMSIFSANALLERMLRLPVMFYEQRSSGELSRRVESNNDVNEFIAGRLSEILLNFLQAALYLMLMLLYDVQLTGVGLCGTLLCVLVSYLTLRPIRELNLKNVQEKSKLTGIICSGIAASAAVKASGVENDYAADILGYYAEATQSEQTLGKAQQIVSTIPNGITSILTVVVMVLGSRFVMAGDMTVGMLTAFCQLLSSFTAPINQLLGVSRSLQETKALYSKIEDIQGATPDVRFRPNKNRRNSPIRKKLSGELCATGLSFGYNPSGEKTVKDFSLRAAPGSRVAIVGASGCGKSTVGKLLSGLLTPDEGTVTYDGVPINDIPLPWLSGSLSVIMQSGAVFTGTLRENITMWKPEIPDDLLYRALADADAEALVSGLDGGIDFVIQEGGKNLSGGQRQKLEIARALVSDPSVIIMDEATSAIDPISEKKIMSNIRRRDCTCIIIAQRLSTIRECDLILVMEDGRVIESGTHEQLMSMRGAYCSLVSSKLSA